MTAPALPESLEAEEVLVACCLISEEALAGARATVTAADFKAPHHRVLWTTLCRLADRGDAIDVIALKLELERTGDLAAAGGFDYLWSLPERVASASHWPHYLKLVLDSSCRRRIMAECSALYHRAADMAQRLDGAASKHIETLQRLVSAAEPNTGTVPVANAAQLLEEETESFGWVVDGLFPQTGVCMLCGDSGTGKSWLMLSLAHSLAVGSPWLNHFPVLPGGTLYFDLESGRRRMKERLRLLASESDELRLVEFVFCDGLRLETDSEADRFRRLVSERKPSLVVLDSLRRVHGGDENDSATANAVCRVLRQAAEDNGCCIFIVHHERKPSGFVSNKGGQGIRGSSDWKANMDCVVTIEKKRPGVVLLEHIKSRDGEEHESFLVELALKETPAAFKYLGRVEQGGKQQEVEDRIIALLSDRGSALRPDILALHSEWGVSEETVRRALRTLTTRGTVEEIPSPGKAKRLKLKDLDLLEG